MAKWISQPALLLFPLCAAHHAMAEGNAVNGAGNTMTFRRMSSEVIISGGEFTNLISTFLFIGGGVLAIRSVIIFLRSRKAQMPPAAARSRSRQGLIIGSVMALAPFMVWPILSGMNDFLDDLLHFLAFCLVAAGMIVLIAGALTRVGDGLAGTIAGPAPWRRAFPSAIGAAALIGFPYLQSAMQGRISSGNLQKIDASALMIDSIDQLPEAMPPVETPVDWGSFLQPLFLLGVGVLAIRAMWITAQGFRAQPREKLAAQHPAWELLAGGLLALLPFTLWAVLPRSDYIMIFTIFLLPLAFFILLAAFARLGHVWDKKYGAHRHLRQVLPMGFIVLSLLFSSEISDMLQEHGDALYREPLKAQEGSMTERPAATAPHFRKKN